jgi:hypothetical protein
MTKVHFSLIFDNGDLGLQGPSGVHFILMISSFAMGRRARDAEKAQVRSTVYRTGQLAGEGRTQRHCGRSEVGPMALDRGASVDWNSINRAHSAKDE